MPPAVIPFTMTTKSFLITILAVMAMMRLFLAVLNALPFWGRQKDQSLKGEPIEGTDSSLSRFVKFCRSVVKRKCKRPDVEEVDVPGD
jgi:hypothetical protein